MHTIRNIRSSYHIAVRDKKGKRVNHIIVDTFPLSKGCVDESGKPIPVLSLLTRYGGLTNSQENFREIAQHLSVLPSSKGYATHEESLKYLKPRYLQSPKEIADFCEWFAREYDTPVEEIESRIASIPSGDGDDVGDTKSAPSE